jgi:hypothetical protein
MKTIIRTESSYTAMHKGRSRAVARATFSDGTKEIVALCDIVTVEGKKQLRKTSR